MPISTRGTTLEPDLDETTSLLSSNTRTRRSTHSGSSAASVNADVNEHDNSEEDCIVRTSSDSSLLVNSVVPPKGRQRSIVTIFALWNTMMGTSILTMPWALEQAGLSFGIIIMLLMMAVCLYTAYRIIDLPQILDLSLDAIEFSDVCRKLLGRWADWTSVFFSVLSLTGALLVYWILMSNFLFNTVTFIYNQIVNGTWVPVKGSSVPSDAFCPNDSTPIPATANETEEDRLYSIQIVHDDELFGQVWNLRTVPVFLILFVAPLVNFKSPTFFAKFNALGTVSVIFIMAFIVVKACTWHFNLDFHNVRDWNYIPQFKDNFSALVGTLTLAYFIHNCVISIMKNQKNPKNNVRDLTIAYFLVCLTYILVGVLFLLSFPMNKLCIEDNLLNNLHNSDPLTFAARLFLFMQMLSVLPMLMFIIRTQILHKLDINQARTKYRHILPINIILIGLAIIVAVFYPHISFMIRFTGAGCGLVYTFALPCLAYMVAMHRLGKLTAAKLIIHSAFIIFGIYNLISQFFVH